MKAASEVEDPGIRKRILSSLSAAEDVAGNVQVRGILKVGKKNDNSNVTADNVVLGKRIRLDSLSEGNLEEMEDDDSKQIIDQYLRSNS